LNASYATVYGVRLNGADMMNKSLRGRGRESSSKTVYGFQAWDA
jgi:hypothetical protein